MTRGNWPSRSQISGAPLVSRAKPSFGKGDVRAWRGELFFVPDEGEPIIRLGGGHPVEAAVPAAAIASAAHLMQTRLFA